MNHKYINVTEYFSNFYLGKYDNFTYQCTDLRQQEFQGKLKRLGSSINDAIPNGEGGGTNNGNLG